ncbi:hypothetical protein AX16_005322 [Volvariella volvacea WC 439]|nr:hypothetical protein AX16_005322 [Volvariella volvacea WC 439]
MPKSNKSSASSGTRKKHAKRAAAAAAIASGLSPSDFDPKDPKSNAGKNKKDKSKGGKGNMKEPRQKIYIPPVKPQPVQPDPLESTGLWRKLPPDLLVVLRSFGKKAYVTKIKALEDLMGEWVERCLKAKEAGDDEEDYEMQTVANTLVEMLPVWYHHLPALFIHPSRRVRQLSAILHAALLRIPQVRDQIIFFLQELATSRQLETILGTWCMAAHDIDRSVSSAAHKSWTDAIAVTADVSNEPPTTDENNSTSLLSLTKDAISAVQLFVRRAALDPQGMYDELNPPPPVAPPPPAHALAAKGRGGRHGGGGLPASRSAPVISMSKRGDDEAAARGKSDELEESETDRRARIRISAFGTIRWLLENVDIKSLDAADSQVDKPEQEQDDIFQNPALWSALYHAESCPFAPGLESFGFAQPNVRKAAWTLLQTLLRSWKGRLQSYIPLLSTAVLRSAWVESDTNVHTAMWQPLLTFLKEFPGAWDLDRNSSLTSSASLASIDEEDEGSDSEAGDEEDDEDEDGAHEEAALKPSKSSASAVSKNQAPESKTSIAYTEFLQFLQLGCGGSPVQGYPTVVIILSTIPSNILMNDSAESLGGLKQFFESLWAAIDGRALTSLHRSVTSAAFFSSLLECLVFIVKRIRSNEANNDSDDSSGDHLTHELVKEQIGRVWDELAERRGLKVEERAAARVVGHTFLELEGLGHGLFDAAWNVFSDKLVQNATEAGGKDKDKDDQRATQLISAFLKGCDDQFTSHNQNKQDDNRERARVAVRALLGRILERSVDGLEGDLMGAQDQEGGAYKPRGHELLVSLLDRFRSALFREEAFAKKLDDVVSKYPLKLFSLTPTLLLGYLAHRKDASRYLPVWHTLLSEIASTSSAGQSDSVGSSVALLLDAITKGHIPPDLKPKGDELDQVVSELLGGVLLVGNGISVKEENATERIEILKRLLQNPVPFLSANGTQDLYQKIASHFHIILEEVLTASASLTGFTMALDLLLVIPLSLVDKTTEWVQDLVADLFLFAYLVPEYRDEGLGDRAVEVYQRWYSAGDKDAVRTVILTRVKELLNATHVIPSTEHILQAVSKRPSELAINLPQDTFPSLSELDSRLDQLPHNSLEPSLAVIDPLIPQSSPSSRVSSSSSLSYDSKGFSTYARIINALLRLFIDDRRLAKSHVGILKHFMALSLYAEDYQSIPGSTGWVFSTDALEHGDLGDLIIKVNQILTYVLRSLGGDEDQGGWSLRAVMTLSAGQRIAATGKSTNGSEALQELLSGVYWWSLESDSVRNSRILRNLLQHALVDVDKAEAEKWIALARSVHRKAPQTSMAIVMAVTHSAPEPANLDRYRNELAASLLGIPSEKANTEGLVTLRKLVASAPDQDSEVEFLPPPRAVNVVKACQQWVSDEIEIDEEVESEMCAVFVQLAPILQNVPGQHWGFMFDVLESNLEAASVTDDSTLVGLARALKLVITVQDLVTTNKALRATWDERKMPILTMVRDLAMVRPDDAKISLPRSTCRELILKIAQNLPESLIDHKTLGSMCHLILDHSPDVQRMAYRLLSVAAKKRTEYYVIEAGVDTESTVKAELPLELLSILQQVINYQPAEAVELEEQTPFGYLLGWMLLFDSFVDASLKVRSGYIDQLRGLDILSQFFFPNLLAILQLDEGIAKSFKLDIWGVDEFYVDLYEPGSTFTIGVLAAHLYYRSLLTLPSLINAWVLDCRDRQLSNTIINYTSQYFAPVLIKTELAHIRSSKDAGELVDSNFNIKVTSPGNEVTASYLVDEHHLEIKLKIPSDWPLHKIEVKDLKRVGVEENLWRAWLLAVQQTIWSHNGRIMDALGLFKKNVTLHFEGQAECAICYSIISTMDGSLPKKPCKTCKNRFHAGCLYKPLFKLSLV